jgi:hypothetical protein
MLTVDRVGFDRPFFELTLRFFDLTLRVFDLTLRVFDLTLRAARAGVLVLPFARVPPFPLIFFLPDIRFVCRVILPSSRMRAPDGCPLLH